MTKEETAQNVAEYLSVSKAEALPIVEKAIVGGETEEKNLAEWFGLRFTPNVVFIDEEGYARMCIDALKILGTTAATDYGSSRQRDLGQLWADMTRGYLGEMAFKLFLAERGVEIELGHEVGDLTDYLPSDIHRIKKSGEEWRVPKARVGIKATKWNGIWFDIPGNQFSHSDLHLLVKVGTSRDHLFAYFKKISIFKDKILRVGQDIGLLSKVEAGNLYDKLPTFKPIPAYIAGFVAQNATYKELSYRGRKGRMHYTIREWNGPINPGDLEKVKNKESLSARGKVQF